MGVPCMGISNCIDVALCKPAFQSSTSKWSTQLGPSGCLQPNVDTPFGFHTGLEDDPWWYVDLLCLYPLEKIVIFNRRNLCQERSKTLRVEISSDFSDWTVLHEGIVLFGYGNKPEPFTIPVSGQLNGRFVRLSLREKTYFHLQKVQIYVDLKQARAAERIFQGFACTLPDRASERKPRASIIGTSNSIMDGFIQALERMNFKISKNLSIGSSHSTIIPFRIDEIDGDDTDILILDFCPNEQRALERGLDFTSLTSDIIEYTSSWCAKNNVIPVGLVLPYLQSYKSIEHFRLRAAQESVFEDKGIPFFSGYDVIDALADLWQRPVESFFADQAHLTKFVSRCLGALLGSSLRKMLSDLACSSGRLDTENHNVNEISVYKATPSHGDTGIIRRKSALIAIDMVRLENGESLSFDIPEGNEVIGIVLNMSKTNGALMIEGKTISIKRLDNSYFDEKKDLWLVVWSLSTSVSASNKGIRVKCVNAEGAEGAEGNDHQEKGRLLSTEKHPPAVEIHGLIVRHPKTDKKVLKISGLELNISKNMDIHLIARTQLYNTVEARR